MHLALLNHQAKRCCCTHMHKFRYLNYQYFDFLNVPTLKRRVSNIILLTDWTKIIFLTAFATRKWSFLYLIIHCLNFHKYLPEDVVFNKLKQGFQWFALLICKLYWFANKSFAYWIEKIDWRPSICQFQ